MCPANCGGLITDAFVVKIRTNGPSTRVSAKRVAHDTEYLDVAVSYSKWTSLSYGIQTWVDANMK